MLCMWAAAKVYPSAAKETIRALFQDNLVAQLTSGADRLEATTVKTVPLDPEHSYLERCVHNIIEMESKPVLGAFRRERKEPTSSALVTFQEASSDDEVDTALPARGTKRGTKGPGCLVKNGVPTHERHVKSSTEETTSTFIKRAYQASSEEEEEAPDEEKVVRPAKAPAKKAKTSAQPSTHEVQIAELRAQTQALTNALYAGPAQSGLGPRASPKSNLCYSDPRCNKPNCRFEHPVRNGQAAPRGSPAPAQAHALAQAPGAPAGRPDIEARIQKFTAMGACRNFHDYGRCTFETRCRHKHAIFNPNGATVCPVHADKTMICSASLGAGGCPCKHVF